MGIDKKYPSPFFFAILFTSIFLLFIDQCVYESGVFPMGSVTGNDLFCILQFRNNEWVEIGFFAGRTYFLKETKTKGYRDIVSQEDIGGAGCFISTSYFKWDGSYYTHSIPLIISSS